MIIWDSFKSLLRFIAQRNDQIECPIGTLNTNNTCTNAVYQALTPVLYTPLKLDSNTRQLKAQGSTILGPQQYLVDGKKYAESTSYGPLECTCTTGIPAENATNLNSGSCYQMSCVNNSLDGQLYIEAAGGTGGDFVYYNDTSVKVQNFGGLPGIVFGIIDTQKGDIIDVTFGYDAGQTPFNGTGLMPVTPGNGGTGSFLGGSSGGGSTTVSLNGNIVMLAPGGGGAGRNASGGNAGNATPNVSNTNIGLVYGQVHPNRTQDGNPGTTFFGTSQTPPSRFPISESGGGGSIRHGIAADGSNSPMYAGGNANAAESGGGGGGSGYYGGAQGTWNKVAKPNNLHGAGGGGSSFVAQQVVGSSSTGGLCQFGSTGNNERSIKVPSNYIAFGYPQ